MNAKEFKRYDRGLIFTIVFLAAAGLLMVLSSSYFMAAVRKSSGLIFFYKQMLWVFLGAVAAWLAAFKIDYRFYRKFIGWGYLIVLVALIAVLIFGPSINGARRWIFFGPISFQPSEFAKLIMIFVMADFIDRRQTRLLKVNVTAPIIFLAPFLIVIALEPDLGSFFLLVFISALMLFYSGVALNKKIVGVIGIGCAILIVQALVLPYRRARLMHYFSGILDMNGVLESSEKTLYQVKMSLFALGSGGPFLGKGPGNSHLKLLYLPEAHTDFI
ncbi:MAG: FtsW/RodA/SpoVE family cell cycle protein, partial [Elusimicrobiota bacterium]|nr:FtsW/RodA/SpoVE family cell cycle protein [Elusimicrobiota bacterium]